MERRFARDIGSLEAVFTFVDEFLAAEGLDAGDPHDLALILEELFTNSVRHGRGSDAPIEISLSRDGSTVTAMLREFDVERFDVTQAGDFDPDVPIARRRPGGMGLHLVRQLSDSIAYDYRARTGTITITKRLES